MSEPAPGQLPQFGQTLPNGQVFDGYNDINQPPGPPNQFYWDGQRWQQYASYGSGGGG